MLHLLRSIVVTENRKPVLAKQIYCFLNIHTCFLKWQFHSSYPILSSKMHCSTEIIYMWEPHHNIQKQSTFIFALKYRQDTVTPSEAGMSSWQEGKNWCIIFLTPLSSLSHLKIYYTTFIFVYFTVLCHLSTQFRFLGWTVKKRH